MTTVVESGVYKTGDLVEASVLSMHGLTPSFEPLGRRALFVFNLGEEDHEFFEGLIDEIRSAKCRVEPKRFAREMKHVRELLYDFLGVGRESRRLGR